jgi:hypothetical protein
VEKGEALTEGELLTEVLTKDTLQICNCVCNFSNNKLRIIHILRGIFWSGI